MSWHDTVHPRDIRSNQAAERPFRPRAAILPENPFHIALDERVRRSGTCPERLYRRQVRRGGARSSAVASDLRSIPCSSKDQHLMQRDVEKG